MKGLKELKVAGPATKACRYGRIFLKVTQKGFCHICFILSEIHKTKWQ
jgi:hypothetical protein